MYSYIVVNNVTFLYGCATAAAYPNCNPQPVPLDLRGVNLMSLDMDSCNATNWKWFDTYAIDGAYATDPRCSGQTPALMNYFSNQITNGTVVLGMTNDEPWTSLGPALPMLLEAGINVTDVEYAGMFAFVMQKGYPAKTVLVKSNSRPTGLSLTVIVARTGSRSNYSHYPRSNAYCINLRLINIYESIFTLVNLWLTNLKMRSAQTNSKLTREI